MTLLSVLWTRTTQPSQRERHIKPPGAWAGPGSENDVTIAGAMEASLQHLDKALSEKEIVLGKFRLAWTPLSCNPGSRHLIDRA